MRKLLQGKLGCEFTAQKLLHDNCRCALLIWGKVQVVNSHFSLPSAKLFVCPFSKITLGTSIDLTRGLCVSLSS